MHRQDVGQRLAGMVRSDRPLMTGTEAHAPAHEVIVGEHARYDGIDVATQDAGHVGYALAPPELISSG